MEITQLGRKGKLGMESSQVRGNRTGEKKEVQELGGQCTQTEGGGASCMGQAEDMPELVKVLFLIILFSQ